MYACRGASGQGKNLEWIVFRLLHEECVIAQHIHHLRVGGNGAQVERCFGLS